VQSLLTVRDVAEILRVSISLIYKLAEANRLPHLKIGGLLRFDPDELCRYVATHAVEPHSSHSTRGHVR